MILYSFIEILKKQIGKFFKNFIFIILHSNVIAVLGITLEYTSIPTSNLIIYNNINTYSRLIQYY